MFHGRSKCQQRYGRDQRQPCQPVVPFLFAARVKDRSHPAIVFSHVKVSALCRPFNARVCANARSSMTVFRARSMAHGSLQNSEHFFYVIVPVL